MQRWTYTVLARGTGLALADALITIYDTGTTDKATLYSTDNISGPTLTNPLETDAYGEVYAYIPDGVYDIRIDHNANPTRTIEEVQIYDLEALEIVASGSLPDAVAALGDLTGSNNTFPYFTSDTVMALADLTNVARQLLDDTTFAAMRTTLGLEIGTNVQAYDAGLADIAGLAVTDGNIIVGDGANWVAESGATARTSLGLAIGTDVQAYDAGLTDISGLAVTDGNIIVGDGANWVAESGATARASLGLIIGTDVQAYDADLASIAALTTTAYGRALLEAADGDDIKPTECLLVACSDEDTAITATGTKLTFRMPYAFTLTDVRGSLKTACATGTFTADVNEGGVSILSTALTIDATEKTSVTAATPVVISDASLADDAEITVDVDNVGDSGATGFKLALIGYRT